MKEKQSLNDELGEKTTKKKELPDNETIGIISYDGLHFSKDMGLTSNESISRIFNDKSGEKTIDKEVSEKIFEDLESLSINSKEVNANDTSSIVMMENMQLLANSPKKTGNETAPFKEKLTQESLDLKVAEEIELPKDTVQDIEITHDLFREGIFDDDSSAGIAEQLYLLSHSTSKEKKPTKKIQKQDRLDYSPEGIKRIRQKIIGDLMKYAKKVKNQPDGIIKLNKYEANIRGKIEADPILRVKLKKFLRKHTSSPKNKEAKDLSALKSPKNSHNKRQKRSHRKRKSFDLPKSIMFSPF